VMRLMSPPILIERKRITGTNADRKARGLLLMNSQKLGYVGRNAIQNYLVRHPKLHELYQWKETLHRFYRTKGQRKAILHPLKPLNKCSGHF
jgi:hypothetical protein